VAIYIYIFGKGKASNPIAIYEKATQKTWVFHSSSLLS
jgi:hypothetical protein